MSQFDPRIIYRPACFHDVADPYHSLKQTWMHRALVRLNGHRQFIIETGYNHHLLPDVLGLPANHEAGFSRDLAISHLQAGLARWELNPVEIMTTSPLERNLAYLADLLGLNQDEIALLRFVVLLKQDALLETACEYIGRVKPSELCQTLSRLLKIAEPAIKAVLSRDGMLFKSGLLDLDKHANADHLSNRFKLTVGFSARMVESEETGMGVFSGYFRPATNSMLEGEAMIHLDPDHLLPNHLDSTLARKSHGVNILIHGAPGTGKTQYARWVCRNVNGSPFEISMQDEDGLPVSGEDRLKAYRIAQSCLESHPRAVLIFDEIEDVFSNRNPEKERTPNTKGWMTRILEENAVPTIWISNQVRQIDPALIRRFDLVIEARVPPQTARAKMLMEATQDLDMPPSWVKQAAQHEDLTPGVIERAARVVCDMAKNLKPEGHARAIEGVLNGVLSAQGHRPLFIAGSSLPGEFYLEATNADQDLDEIVNNLERCHSARLCLYGPPGTGKSAFGRFVSDKLGRPLHVKRASDLLSPFLGMAEKAFANMFHEAQEDGAVLLLDEADTFLQDRGSARHSWEISQVNEMLTQIEVFEGLFIATTNLIDSMDPAVMRRFDMKIHFNFLEPHQADLLLQKTATHLGIPSELNQSHVKELTRYKLTPGDFAVAARQSRFKKIASIGDLMLVLEQEAKQRGRIYSRPLGFV